MQNVMQKCSVMEIQTLSKTKDTDLLPYPKFITTKIRSDLAKPKCFMNWF